MSISDQIVEDIFVKHLGSSPSSSYAAGVFYELISACDKKDYRDEMKWKEMVFESIDNAKFGDRVVTNLLSDLEGIRLKNEGGDSEEDEDDEEMCDVMVGDLCLGILVEDGEWHQAVVEEIIVVDNDAAACDESKPSSSKKNKNKNKKKSQSQDISGTKSLKFKVRFTEFGKPQVLSREQLVLDRDIVREDDENGRCLMCEREMPLTRHHLIPKMTHDKYLKKGFSPEVLQTTVAICRGCHSKLHRIEDEETLAREYYTLEKILAHPEIQRWIVYARKIKKQTKWDHKMLMRK